MKGKSLLKPEMWQIYLAKCKLELSFQYFKQTMKEESMMKVMGRGSKKHFLINFFNYFPKTISLNLNSFQFLIQFSCLFYPVSVWMMGQTENFSHLQICSPNFCHTHSQRKRPPVLFHVGKLSLVFILACLCTTEKISPPPHDTRRHFISSS